MGEMGKIHLVLVVNWVWLIRDCAVLALGKGGVGWREGEEKIPFSLANH